MRLSRCPSVTLAGDAKGGKGKQFTLTFTSDEYPESIALVFNPITATHLRHVPDGGVRVVAANELITEMNDMWDEWFGEDEW